MKVMPIRYAADMAASTRFYEALGLMAGDQSRSGNWVELPAAGGLLALHTARTSQRDEPGGSSCPLRRVSHWRKSVSG